MNIGDRIRKIRQEQRRTLQWLASKTGTTRQTIQRYETGDISNIPSDKIEKIALALNVTPSYLMGWEEISIDNLNKEARNIESISDYLSLISKVDSLPDYYRRESWAIREIATNQIVEIDPDAYFEYLESFKKVLRFYYA